VSKRVAILQSNYIPWKGYFDIIQQVDLFIFYDDVQYTKSDWRNRNKIKTDKGAEWVSVPVGDDNNRLICEVVIGNPAWQIKHWRSLQQNYGRSPYFDRYRSYFEHVYLGQQWTSLSALNQALIKHIAREFLGIVTEFADSRRWQVHGHKMDRLLELAMQSGATTYLSGPSAKDYIDPERFQKAGIYLEWMSYAGYPEYPQRFPPFEHGVSILDLLFNVGPDSPWYIWAWRNGGSGP